jgi:hypothetical protein
LGDHEYSFVDKKLAFQGTKRKNFTESGAVSNGCAMPVSLIISWLTLSAPALKARLES